MNEQFNVYRILLRYDRKSRHRKIKKQRRYERLIVTNQFVNFNALNERRQFVSKISKRFCIFASVWTSINSRSFSNCQKRHFRNQMQRRRHVSIDKRNNRYLDFCDNFSDISSLKFREIKESIDHTFMICIHIENQIQEDFYSFVLLKISVLHEFFLEHLRYDLTNVSFQSNFSSNNVFNSNRFAKNLNVKNWTMKFNFALLNK